MDIQEVALETLVRLPLKSIARFRSVSKEWKSLIDSDYFRDHFLATNSSSSVSWSIIQTKPHKLTLEIVGYYGCKTWGLNKTPGSSVQFFVKTPIRKLMVLACTDGLVLIFTETIDRLPRYYIGNVLTKEWLRIPLPPTLNGQTLMRLRMQGRFNDSGLVTKMQSGIVISYKIVWFVKNSAAKVESLIYSSDSWSWDLKNVTFLPSNFLNYRENSLALNGILHWFSNLSSSSFIANDFYEDNARDVYRTISYPDIGKDGELPLYMRTLTTSEGSIVYFNEFHENENIILRIWKLVKYIDGPDAWQLSWEVDTTSLIRPCFEYFPVVMHPLKSEIIYLWSRDMNCMLLFNLRTESVFCHYEEETGEDSICMDGSMLSFNNCSHYMNEIGGYFFPSTQANPSHVLFTQFVLPRWFHRLPRPQPPS